MHAIEHLTAKIMEHPPAARMFERLCEAPTRPHLGALADMHGNMITKGDYTSHAMALGVEYYLRQMAIAGSLAEYDAVARMDKFMVNSHRKRKHLKILREGRR